MTYEEVLKMNEMREIYDDKLEWYKENGLYVEASFSLSCLIDGIIDSILMVPLRECFYHYGDWYLDYISSLINTAGDIPWPHDLLTEQIRAEIALSQTIEEMDYEVPKELFELVERNLVLTSDLKVTLIKHYQKQNRFEL